MPARTTAPSARTSIDPLPLAYRSGDKVPVMPSRSESWNHVRGETTMQKALTMSNPPTANRKNQPIVFCICAYDMRLQNFQVAPD